MTTVSQAALMANARDGKWSSPVSVAQRIRSSTQLSERGVEDSDVVGGGVAARVALAQRDGEELAGVVAERQQRVIPERALERRCRLLLLAVTHRDRGVQIDHQPGQVAPGSASPRERLTAEFGALHPDHLSCRSPRRRTR